MMQTPEQQIDSLRFALRRMLNPGRSHIARHEAWMLGTRTIVGTTPQDVKDKALQMARDEYDPNTATFEEAVSRFGTQLLERAEFAVKGS